MAFQIRVSPEVEEQLRGLTARQQATLVDAIREQLSHQPMHATRNRKRMRPNPLAGWELRVGNLRVFYDVTEEPEPTVDLRAVGVKVRDRVYIDNKEVDV